MTTDSTKAAAVDQRYHWRRITPAAPRGVKMQLINREAGVAIYGTLPCPFATHWAPLPTFEDEDE